mmetsp:Transcript_5626/g.14292  ORF Transcript_5626/g.14292 Transcript_5626/m.14292 type:complete len:250 (-) Transcript_5626:734-1483(-)
MSYGANSSRMTSARYLSRSPFGLILGSPVMWSICPMVIGQVTVIWSSSCMSISPDLRTPYFAWPQMSQRPFVPPKPNDETPVSALFSIVSMASVSKKHGKPATDRCGLSCRQWAFGGHVPASSMRMHFRSPAIPAPPSKWPMFDLELVRARAVSLGSMALRSAPTSMGSPSAVPVPWHSARLMSRASLPASRIEAWMHTCCDGPFGAVMLALRPSWLIWALSRQETWLMRSFSSELALRNMRPTPSPRA